MDRRELLKMIAVLTGGVIIGGEVFLTGCKTGAKTGAGFTATNIALLDEIGETIIPATATPGAKAAKVGEFMKVMVTDCYTQAEQDAFMKGLNTFEEACKKANDKIFMDCSPQQRHDFLVSLEKEAKGFNKAVSEKDKPVREEFKQKGRPYNFVASPKHYYTMMKQLTLLGFYSSETGMTETLRHIPVPGKYDGTFPYAKGDKAWAE
ncbi:MAG: gluconate 2-dehydrogenase subunit 3 family protein [Chitinophagaceae bacterium]